MGKKALELVDITKTFGLVVANDKVNFTLERGEIHALLGENGAGKSTLMKVLFGILMPDSGRIYVRGEAVRPRSPLDALEYGLGMVHQSFMLIPAFTVTENIILGISESSGRFLNVREAEKGIKRLSVEYGLDVDPRARVADLSVGARQRVEIMRALYRDAEILILDEPTSVLTPGEVDLLFGVLSSLRQEGHSVIFISHKLPEVLTISDRITVLRNGRNVGTVRAREADERMLAEMMVGREVVLRIKKKPRQPGREVLRVDGLTVRDLSGGPGIRDVSLSIREGEIVGLAGVAGNGQTLLMRCLVGLAKPDSGEIRIYGEPVRRPSPRKMIELGVGRIPEDRLAEGVFSEFLVWENLISTAFWCSPFSKLSILNLAAIQSMAAERVKRFDVRPPDIRTRLRSMSGGNQQKVVLARELGQSPNLIIASQPTCGLDVAATEYVYRQLLERRGQGAGILLISTELDEILSLSDRVAVIYNGCIVRQADVAATTREEIGLLMAGGGRDLEEAKIEKS